MSRAFDRGLWQGVVGCVDTRTTYDQFSWSPSAMELALMTFAVETMISFLAKVQGQSVLRHGQSFARNSRFRRTLGGSARTGHDLDVSILGISAFGLRASSGSDQPGRNSDWMIGGRYEKGIGPRGTSRSACPCSPLAPRCRWSEWTIAVTI
jgi:hypothetical protein